MVTAGKTTDIKMYRADTLYSFAMCFYTLIFDYYRQRIGQGFKTIPER